MQVNYMLLDSLVEQSMQGSFVPHGCQDILTTTIRKSEHPSCVRGVGRGIGIRQYFEPLPIMALPRQLSAWNI